MFVDCVRVYAHFFLFGLLLVYYVNGLTFKKDPPFSCLVTKVNTKEIKRVSHAHTKTNKQRISQTYPNSLIHSHEEKERKRELIIAAIAQLVYFWRKYKLYATHRFV